MESKTIQNSSNPLETESIWKLMRKFAVPAIITGLVNSLYNIVDQIFIGQSIGTLGNAATNVAFPLVIILTAFGMMIGVGAASNFSIKLGAGEKEKAAGYVGNSIVCLMHTVSAICTEDNGLCVLESDWSYSERYIDDITEKFNSTVNFIFSLKNTMKNA